MKTKRLKKALGILLALSMCLMLLPAAVFASQPETPAASDNATCLYADYGNGFELLTALYFGKGVSEQSVTVEKPILALRVVKGNCYTLHLDQLTLGGISPEEYERKLSKTDNDLLEIEDSADFALSGSGELKIAARAPVELAGEEYSLKFPERNRLGITAKSEFYSYTVGSHPGAIASDALKVPAKDDLFQSVMCYPDSGHPSAPIDFYVTDDGETLYVFFEAFVDNTLDNGKDFAAVHVKCGDALKTYKVYTTDENEYGNWWFDYTDTSVDSAWEHMSYLVKVPMSEIETKDGKADLAFEYYGTVSLSDKLQRFGIGNRFFIDKAYRDQSTYNQDYYADAELLPEAGETVNSSGGNTESGDWWLKNTGTADEPTYTLTLNGADITETVPYMGENYTYLYADGSLTVVLTEGTTNTIGTRGTTVRYGFDVAGSKDVIIMGEGTLCSYASNHPYYTEGSLTVCDGATVHFVLDNSDVTTSWGQNAAQSFGMGSLTIDNASLDIVSLNNATEEDSYAMALTCWGDTLELKNNANFEAYAAGAAKNVAICGDFKLILDQSADTLILEGDAPDTASEVSELTNLVKALYGDDYYYADREFYSKAYVKITQRVTASAYSITVNGGKAYSDEDYTNEITEAAPGTTVYLYPTAVAGKVAANFTSNDVDFDAMGVFTMPENDVVIDPIYVDQTPLEIDLSGGSAVISANEFAALYTLASDNIGFSVFPGSTFDLDLDKDGANDIHISVASFTPSAPPTFKVEVLSTNSVTEDVYSFTEPNVSFYYPVSVRFKESGAEPVDAVSFTVTNIPKGGEKTATIGNGIDVSYDSDKYIILPDQYAESVSDSENLKWFEGTFKKGTTYYGSALIVPLDDVNGAPDFDIIGGTFIKCEPNYTADDQPAGDYKVYFSVPVSESAKVIKSAAFTDVTLPEDGDEYFEPELPDGEHYTVFDAYWEDEDGEIPETFEEGGDYYLVADLVPERGYIFSDSIDISLNGKKAASVKPEDVLGKTEIKIKVSKTNTYTVTFNANGGSVKTDTAETNERGKLDSIPTPSRSGYSFKGWFTDSRSGGEEIDRNTVFEEDTEVFAQWKKKSSSGSSGGGGGAGSVTSVSTKDDGKKGFADVADTDYFKEAVLWAVEKGITSGTSATTFSPFEPCTRAQMVTFIWRYMGSPAPSITSCPFEDVSESDYFYNAILWAYETGVAKGTSETAFSPGDTVTRAQAVAFMHRILQQDASIENPFEDVFESDYYFEAVLWAYANGITVGTTAATFSPNESCLRGQIVTFLYRLSKL